MVGISASGCVFSVIGSVSGSWNWDGSDTYGVGTYS